MKRKFRKKAKAVSASELAQMGVCERLVVFEHRYGTHHTAARRAAIRRGLQEHERFFRDGVQMSEKRGRCYIATLAFGTGQETAVLRMFRDRILRPNATGRWLILVYYKTAPAVCTVLEHWPWLQPIIRAVLRPMVWVAGRVLQGHEDDHPV
ncbi:MAG TPA: CFI-box-CTERM domain-containing protein [Noviherbaspirillum sp.]